MEATRVSLDRIIGRTLLAAEALLVELRERLINAAVAGRAIAPIIEQIESVLAQVHFDSETAAWIAGMDLVNKKTPAHVLDALLVASPLERVPTLIEGSSALVRFPAIDNAVKSLIDREIVSRDVFDAMELEARRKAFTVARVNSDDVISTIRDVSAENVREGASLGGFRSALEERIGTSQIGPGHLENVYRTNIQTAFHDGLDALAADPVIMDVFPYQEYIAVHDDRAREEHLELEKLGLDGTNIYRRDDPFWDVFRPPWGYQCRCGVNLLTIEAAARRGVEEAQTWEFTGNAPAQGEHRLQDIPFRPDPSFA